MSDYKYKLSIVIPVRIYDGNQMDKYAQQCIDSIQKAKDVESHFSDFQVILVDDDSENYNLNDLTVDQRLNFKVVRNKAKRGIGGSRNAGLEIAEGKWIWYLDGDDMLCEEWCKLFQHIDEDCDKDMQMYFVAFETVSMVNMEQKTATKRENKMDMADYSACPVTASGKIVRRDKCVQFPENVYLEDVKHNYQQLDSIDGKENVRTLNDTLYWRYLNIRPTAYTRTNNYLQSSRPSFFQLLAQDILCKGSFKDCAVSDLLRACADLYDLRHTLKHGNVKGACVSRCMRIMDNIKTDKWTH